MRYFNFTIVLIFFGIIFLFNSCATTGSTDQAEEIDRLLVENPSFALKDYLKRLSGVQINESGGEVRVMIRGTSTLSGDNSPLFVVNGSRVGNRYSDVESAVDIRDVQYIRVLRGSEAMTTYGMTASHGAIIIETKR